MKNWKRWLAAGCMAALLGIGTMGTTAMAMGGGGVDRSDAVAEEERIEKVPSGKACLLYTSPSPRDDWLSRMPSSA